jgi:hypothetical protein
MQLSPTNRNGVEIAVGRVQPGKLQLKGPGHGLLDGGGAGVHAVLMHYLQQVHQDPLSYRTLNNWCTYVVLKHTDLLVLCGALQEKCKTCARSRFIQLSKYSIVTFFATL